MNSKTQLERIYNFLKGTQVSEDEVIQSINKMTNFQQSNNIKVKLKYCKTSKHLKFILKEKRRIKKKNYLYCTTNAYKISSFNKNILKLIEKNVDHNFESNLFENLLPNSDNQLDFYKNIKSSLDIIIKRILSSKGAKQFFDEFYGKKYKGLVYHFNRNSVQEEIIKRISFAPIYKESDKAFTNPMDMTITINSLPGKIENIMTHSFNRKILHLGRILVFALHEILGHFLRRYYSYFTGMKIPFNTKEDTEINAGEEGGFFVESHFLGLKSCSSIGLNTILHLLYPKLYIDYPFLKKDKLELNLDGLQIIINENKSLFNFIVEKEGDKKNELNMNKDIPQISLEDYLDIIKHLFSLYRIYHCHQIENYSIYLDNIYDF